MQQKYHLNNLNRMTTSIKVEMKQISNGIYRKILNYNIHKLDEKSNIISTTLDKTVEGPLYKIAGEHERSRGYGEMMFTLPGDKKPIRFIALEVRF